MLSKNNKAAFKIALHFSLLIVILALVISTMVAGLLRYSIRRHQEKGLKTTLTLLADNAATSRQNRKKPFTAPGYNIIPAPFSYALYDIENGKLLFSSGPAAGSAPQRFEDTSGTVKKYFARATETEHEVNILYSNTNVTIKMPMWQNLQNKRLPPPENFLEERTVCLQVWIDLNMDFSNQILKFLPAALALIFVPLVFLSFIVAYIIAKKTLKPVKIITQTAQNISSSTLDQRLPVSKNKNEFDQLAQTFNVLFEKLDKDFKMERSFTGNVSHELKTPIAVIAGQSNLLMRWGKDDRQQLEKSVAIINDESRRMQNIVENLLFLSRLESGKTRTDKTQVYLLPMVKQLAEQTWHSSPDVEFDFSLIEETSSVVTDYNLLYQILSILASNSTKFCGSDLTIKIAFSDNKLYFKDNGPGIAPEVLPHIFERFYKGDSSHNRQAGGCGLGLSIAKQIADLLNIKISAQNKEGTLFTLEF